MGASTSTPHAVIVDLDETLCMQFNCPVREGVELLRRIDHNRVEVHYVTARTEASRRLSEQFLAEYRLPGRRNLHLSPTLTGSREHKLKVHLRLAREYQVIASIGDSFEEAEASAAAGVPFVLVDPDRPAAGWSELAKLVAAANGFMPSVGDS